MGFVASKERKRRKPKPPGVGKALGSSAALRIWYQNAIWDATQRMIEDYRNCIKEAMRQDEVKQLFGTMDASPFKIFNTVLAFLDSKWTDYFSEFAKNISKEFIEKSDQHAKSSTFYSLSAAGVEHPTAAYNDAVVNTLQTSRDFNYTLITNIQKDTHESLYKSIMLSLTSPNPEEQGASGIANALKEVGITSKKRVDLIARDQTSKVYSALSTERMQQNGVEYFEWAHSAGGKVPRQSHIDKDGVVFKVDDPKLWEGPKADQGPPGWAINCRCRAIPLIGYVPGE